MKDFMCHIISESEQFGADFVDTGDLPLLQLRNEAFFVQAAV